MCEECINIECVDTYINPCDTGINTGIIIPENEEYTVLIEFNGVTKTLTIEGTEGVLLVLPNVFMPPYVHMVRIYDRDNVLLNDTCYKFNTHLALGAGNNLNPTPEAGAKKIIVVDVDGNSFTNSFFGLHTIIEIVTNNQSYITGVDFEQSGSTITWINGNKFFDGQVILAIA